jgi:hypothetical protein
MIQVEPITNFDGFGIGQGQGEYFHSQGMNKSLFGITPKWKISSSGDSSTLTLLQLINWFTQGQLGGTSYDYAFDAGGWIYRSTLGLTTWNSLYKPAGANHGNGAIFDQKNRFLYATDRYLGYYDGTGSDYITGSVNTTSGSPNIVGVGTSWDATHVGKTIQLSGDPNVYRVASVTDATHLALDSNYNQTGTGSSYTIFKSWTDQWKDFGSTLTTTDFRPMDTYEDWVVIGNKNQVALLNITDDSFNANGLNLLSGFNIRCIKSGRTGILIGANFNNRGVLILWDAYSTRSIAPWIWRNANIQCIVPTDDGWIVFTTKGIYETNGYSIQPLMPKLPDDIANSTTILANLLPQGADIINNKLVFWGSFGDHNRKKAGLYVLDLETKLMEFVRVSNGCTYGVTGGAVFFDNNYSTQLSYTTSTPNTKFIGRLLNSAPTQAHLISQQLGQGQNQSMMLQQTTAHGQNEKVAEGVKFTFGLNNVPTSISTQTFDASVKVYNFKRQLYTYAQTRAASTSADVLKIDGTQVQYNKAQVGDEVTILHGVNAGQVRHITSIANQGTNTETWTLDSVLPNNTEINILMNVSPFRLAHKFTSVNLSQLQELFFDVQDRIRGKKFLVKLLLDNISTDLEIELKEGQFIYNDLGLKR